MWLRKYLSKKLIKICKTINNFLVYFQYVLHIFLSGFTGIWQLYQIFAFVRIFITPLHMLEFKSSAYIGLELLLETIDNESLLRFFLRSLFVVTVCFSLFYCISYYWTCWYIYSIYWCCLLSQTWGLQVLFYFLLFSFVILFFFLVLSSFDDDDED